MLLAIRRMHVITSLAEALAPYLGFFEFDIKSCDLIFDNVALSRERKFHDLVYGNKDFIPPVIEFRYAYLLNSVLIHPVIAAGLVPLL